MSKKKDMSIEEKVAIVRAYVGQKISISEAARRAGVDYETVSSWVRNYETEGVDAFLPHKDKAYSPELKGTAVKSYLAGKGSLSQICKNMESEIKKHSGLG